MAEESSFERRLGRLKEIVEALERGDLDLEDAVALYREGLDLARSCGAQLEAARQEVKVLSEGLLKEFGPPEAEGEGDGL
ncbi:MAG: exodeoxyribonuclease VII small subunit [Desulfovibrionaceae bacterium]|nr:exodeoxyribonuclease VII small subunit [Desulfovibrionaceae bacterium]